MSLAASEVQLYEVDGTVETEIADIVDITPPNVVADDIERSNMMSTDQFKEFAAGWADAGEITASIQFDKTFQDTVWGLYRESTGYKVKFSDGSYWSGDGYIKAIGNETPRDGDIMCNITIKCSGVWDFEPAT